MSTEVTIELERLVDLEGQIAAIGRSQAVIEFDLAGNVLTANANFCRVLGYSLDEIRGRPHAMFVEQGYRNSEAYRQFWMKLGRGEYDAGQYLRIGKDGREVWIQATYNPIRDRDGRTLRVVKYATDITDQKRAEALREHALEEAARVITALSAGDLTQRMDGSYDGGFARLQAELNASMETLHSTVQQIRSASSSITSAAGEISQGNTDLSQRTEEQASSLEETAASIEELTSTVKQNADNAREASQLAVSAREQATRGGEVVQTAVVAMGAINESSKKIADIIGVIDEIAFQTNLLALNAAVEAARAGEQGRGFAVVASEVRNLAQRSAGAAKEIKTLINDSVRKVDEGSKLVNASGLTLTEIVTSVRRVADIIAEIAAASAEQSSGIDQVNKAVGQMDQVTQQNAALVEEAAAAAESLDDQARALLEVVGFFETGDAARAAFTPARGASSQTRPRAARLPHATQSRPTPPRAAASRPLAAPATARTSTSRPALQPRIASTARAAAPHAARPAFARPDAVRPAVTAPARPPEGASTDDWEDF
jgi:methyl-accepting chemotaxis protein